MEWLTRPRRPDQPFGSWADDLAAAFVRLEPRRIADQPFEGAISKADAGPIQVSLVTATGHTVLRLASHVVSSTDDLCFVNLQLEGLGRTTQRNHEQISTPGDLALADTTEPFEIANRSDFKLFCFAVPRRLLPIARLKSPATQPVGDRNWPRSLPNARQLRRTLPEWFAAAKNLGTDRHARNRAHFVRARNSVGYLRGARAYSRAAVDDA